MKGKRYKNRYNRNEPFTNTYSIVARDEKTGEFGIAVQSHWFAVGTAVPWIKPGVGVVATQSFVKLEYATYGLEMMESGKKPSAIMKKLLKKDPSPEIRQIVMMNAEGELEAFTGDKCVGEAGHIIGNGFSVQGNMMFHKETLQKMAIAFEKKKGPLAIRMLHAMKAADQCGGDIRGKQSACMKIVSPNIPKHQWDGIMLDIRVDDHHDPINELERLLRIHAAYHHMNRGELAFGENDMEEAFRQYAEAQKLYPDNHEMSFWQAISLANIGKYHEAYGILYILFDESPQWKELTRRLITAEILNVDIEFIEKIFSDDPEIIDDILEENFKKFGEIDAMFDGELDEEDLL